MPSYIATRAGLVAESDTFFANHDIWLVLSTSAVLDNESDMAEVVASEVTAIARVQVNDTGAPITAAYDVTDSRSETSPVTVTVSNSSGSTQNYRSAVLAIDATGTSSNTTGTVWRILVEDSDQSLPDGTSRNFNFEYAQAPTSF